MRVISTFTIYGRRSDLQSLAGQSLDLNLRQIGLRRKVPALDEWCINTPYFTLDIQKFDIDMKKYIAYLQDMVDFKSINKSKFHRAVLYIIPVYSSLTGEKFYGSLEPDTLGKLADLGCALEISPASIMPASRTLS